jgi:hypothetical protein
MSTGDETQAGLPPSVPPRRPDGVSEPVSVAGGADQGLLFGSDDGLGSAESMDRFFEAVDEPGTVRRTGSQPRILAPQANDWAEQG